MRSKYDWNEIHRGPSIVELLTFISITIAMLLSFFIAVAYGEEFQDDIVIGSLNPQSQSHLGRSVNVIDNTLFEEYKPLMLTDIIHNVPGVYVKRVNGLSGLTSIRIRGARSFDTKLLYNGLPLQDPSDPQGSANPLIGDLASSGISRVEVLSGTSSTLWGSEAIGGVLNIIPKKGDKDAIRLSGEYGTFNTATEEAEVSNRLGYANVRRLDSDGFDAHDDYENTSSNGDIAFSPSDRIHVEYDYLYSKVRARLNDGPIIFGGKLLKDEDDPTDKREYELFHSGLVTTLDVSDSVAYKNKIGYADSDRRFIFIPDAPFEFSSDGTFHGNDLVMQNLLTVTHNENLSTAIGHQYNRAWYELETLGEADEADEYRNDYYAEELIDYNNLHLQLGLRENTHEHGKDRATYDVAGSYKIDQIGTTLKSHYGTGFRSPSLYERYGAFLSEFGRFEVGNPDLSPERARSFDIGFETTLYDRLTAGLIYFDSRIGNRIDFVGFGYANTDGEYETDGIESFVETYLMDGLSFRASYTKTNGKELIDMPEDVFQASLRYAKDKWIANIRYEYDGKHKILAFNLDDFTVDKLDEDSRHIVSATVAYKIKPNVEIYCRGENIFGEDYSEGGYRTPNARVYGGIKWTI